jgi:hypothetical protein
MSLVQHLHQKHVQCSGRPSHINPVNWVSFRRATFPDTNSGRFTFRRPVTPPRPVTPGQSPIPPSRPPSHPTQPNRPSPTDPSPFRPAQSAQTHSAPAESTPPLISPTQTVRCLRQQGNMCRAMQMRQMLLSKPSSPRMVAPFDGSEHAFWYNHAPRSPAPTAFYPRNSADNVRAPESSRRSPAAGVSLPGRACCGNSVLGSPRSWSECRSARATSAIQTQQAKRDNANPPAPGRSLVCGLPPRMDLVHEGRYAAHG